MTKESARQFDSFRKDMHRQLAKEILHKIHPKTFQGTWYFTGKMVKNHEDHILQMLGQVRAFYNCNERRYLYKNNNNLSLSVVRLILRSVGHPCYKYDGNKFALAPQLSCYIP